MYFLRLLSVILAMNKNGFKKPNVRLNRTLICQDRSGPAECEFSALAIIIVLETDFARFKMLQLKLLCCDRGLRFKHRK